MKLRFWQCDCTNRDGTKHGTKGVGHYYPCKHTQPWFEHVDPDPAEETLWR